MKFIIRQARKLARNKTARHPAAPPTADIVHPDAPRRQARGQIAEELAADYLQARGLAVLARNVRCRGGEIDLVCLQRSTVIFVEVRLRRPSAFASAAESITWRKQQRILLAARWWLQGSGRRFHDAPCRFDAILLDQLSADRITWLQAAFDAG